VPLLDRADPRRSLVLCLGLAAGGYGLVALLPFALPALALALLVVGVGFGSNALLVKALAGAADAGRLTRYSALNVAVNAGAALGPLGQTWLFLHLGPRSSFAAAAACFAAAAILMSRYPSHASTRARAPVSWLRTLRHCLAIVNVRVAVIAYGLLLLLATQLYAVLPLMATRLLHATDLLGVYFALNAVVVVVAQMPATRLAAALGISPANLIRLGFLSYGVGFLLLWLWPVWQVAFVMVVTCSLAEVLIPPGLDSILASALPASMRVSGFALTAAAAASGEAIGLSIGVAAAGQLALHGELQDWYGVLAVAAAAAIAPTALMAAGPRLGTPAPRDPEG
jgi:MFS family permease